MAESEPAKKSPLGKIRLEVPPPAASGSCPFHNWFYIFLAVLGVSYAVFLQDKEAFRAGADSLYLGPVHTVFQFVENYSPFNEFLESDEELIAKLQGQREAREGGQGGLGEASEGGQGEARERVFTKAELAQYTGRPASPGLYLALLGVVYDVSSGRQYYGEGGGYSFFSGRDASRAFVSGQFDEEGLVEEVAGLAGSDYLGLEEWQAFYESDYTRVGLLEGAYYTAGGLPTARWREVQGWTAEAREESQEQDVEKQMFPPCNVEWKQASGSRFWCTTKSGGVAREWPGVPRQLFYPGRETRCACVRTRGAPSTDPGDTRRDRGDLDSPHLKEYPGCGEDSVECRHKE